MCVWCTFSKRASDLYVFVLKLRFACFEHVLNNCLDQFQRFGVRSGMRFKTQRFRFAFYVYFNPFFFSLSFIIIAIIVIITIIVIIIVSFTIMFRGSIFEAIQIWTS